MPRFKLTEKHKEFIRNNYSKMSRKKMAQALVIGVTPINTFMRKNGLKVSKKQSKKFRVETLRGRTTFSETEDDFIKKNYLKLPVKTIAKKLNRSGCGINGRMKALHLVIPKSLAKQRKKIGMFRKGQSPPNKGRKQVEYMTPEAIEKTKATRFKKGGVNHNMHPDGDGAITIRNELGSERSYKFIRISKGCWMPYQHYLWQQKFGEIPKGYCLWFKNGDSMDCRLENLELITRAENLDRNWHNKYPQELKNSIKKVNKLNKIIKQKSNGKFNT